MVNVVFPHPELVAPITICDFIYIDFKKTL